MEEKNTSKVLFFFWRWRNLWGTGSNPAGATFGILFLFVCFIVFLRFGLFLFILTATLLRGFCDEVYLVYSITMKNNQLLLKKYIAHDVCNAERKSYHRGWGRRGFDTLLAVIRQQQNGWRAFIMSWFSTLTFCILIWKIC